MANLNRIKLVIDHAYGLITMAEMACELGVSTGRAGQIVQRVRRDYHMPATGDIDGRELSWRVFDRHYGPYVHSDLEARTPEQMHHEIQNERQPR